MRCARVGAQQNHQSRKAKSIFKQKAEPRHAGNRQPFEWGKVRAPCGRRRPRFRRRLAVLLRLRRGHVRANGPRRFRHARWFALSMRGKTLWTRGWCSRSTVTGATWWASSADPRVRARERTSAKLKIGSTKRLMRETFSSEIIST